MYQIFPQLTAEEYRELKEDISARGVQVPVELDDKGNILDGHHRVKICQELGIENYPTVTRYGFTEKEKLLPIRKLNIARRHLNQEQKRNLIEEQLKETPELSDRQIAKEFQVDHKTVGSARDDLEGRGEIPHVETVTDTLGRKQPRHRSVFSNRENKQKLDLIAKEKPELLEAVDKGKESVNSAYRKITRYQNRNEKFRKLQKAELPKEKFNVLLADPPWRYEHSISSSRDVENQYPTMSLQDICDLPINELAHDNSILFLWATSPKLEEAMKVIKSWGFEYRTFMVWVKDKMGMGYYARQRHEALLIARKGSFPPPLEANRFDSIIEAPRGKHSKKPEIVHETIEKMYPGFKYIELFSRKRRDNWHSWGNEIDKFTNDTERMVSQRQRTEV
jgi:N6-adenosine-specific RNA methylase IME4